jgi:hypothetical protein
MVPVEGRGPESQQWLEGLANPQGFAPKTLIYKPRDSGNGTQRAIQSLSSCNRMHHGKRTLGNDASPKQQRRPSRPAKGV